MKKSLLALAAMGAFAGTAHAQSSVSVYGLLDMGYSSVNTKTSAAAAVDTTTSGLFVSQPLANSRLGFRGVEDLGGGLTAGFQFEGNVHVNPGTSGSNNATGNAQGFQFGRHQFVTLTSKTAGGLLLGKTDALVKQIFDSYDAGFANNLTGAYDGMGTSLSDVTGDNVIGTRRDSILRYTSPSLGGVNLSAGYMKNSVKVETGGVSTTDTETSTGYELGARYAVNKISAGLAYRSAKDQSMAVAAVATAAATATANGVLGSAAVAAANNVTNSWAAGLSYNFGPAIGYLQYFNQAIKNEIASTEVKESAYALGARVPLGAVTAFASYTTGSKTSATNIDSKMTGYQAGALYALSKRTDLYALYGASKMKADNVANEGTAQGMAIGVRHTF
jgi:predicted porin